MNRRLTPAQRVDDAAPEDAVLAALIDAARFGGWLVSHHRDSRSHQGDPGLPDLVCAHRSRGVVFIEAKTRTGCLSDAQQRWLAALASAGARGDGKARRYRPAGLMPVSPGGGVQARIALMLVRASLSAGRRPGAQADGRSARFGSAIRALLLCPPLQRSR